MFNERARRGGVRGGVRGGGGGGGGVRETDGKEKRGMFREVLWLLGRGKRERGRLTFNRGGFNRMIDDYFNLTFWLWAGIYERVFSSKL